MMVMKLKKLLAHVKKLENKFIIYMWYMDKENQVLSSAASANYGFESLTLGSVGKVCFETWFESWTHVKAYSNQGRLTLYRLHEVTRRCVLRLSRCLRLRRVKIIITKWKGGRHYFTLWHKKRFWQCGDHVLLRSIIVAFIQSKIWDSKLILFIWVDHVCYLV